jgi:hypothetical protein
MAAMIAASMTFAETLILPLTANAATSYECDLREGYCRSGCHYSDIACRWKCTDEWNVCRFGNTGTSTHARPERPKGRPIKPAHAPQGVKPTGGLLDTKPGLPGQGPASTGGAVLNARPSTPPQIR